MILTFSILLQKEGVKRMQEMDKTWRNIFAKQGGVLSKLKENPSMPKYYCLSMFPYPSGELLGFTNVLLF